MKIDYIEQQATGGYKFYRIDSEAITGGLEKQKYNHEIPAHQIPQHIKEKAIRKWQKQQVNHQRIIDMK